MRWRVGPSTENQTNTVQPDSEPGRGEFGEVAAFYDHLMATVPYRSWVDYLEAILERRLARPRRVLDLCCGTGRVGAELLRRGYSTVGVDLSEPMVRRCAGQAPPLSAAVQNACQLGFRDASFELVVSLFDSFNYITQPEGLACCFRDVYRALGAGGLFIFDLNTQRALSVGLFNQDNLRTDDPLLYTWKAHWNPLTRLCRVDMWFKWRGEGGPQEITETHWQYAYHADEVVGMLQEAGFVAVTTFDAYTFNAPHRKSDRIYYVARKE